MNWKIIEVETYDTRYYKLMQNDETIRVYLDYDDAERNYYKAINFKTKETLLKEYDDEK